MKLNIANLPLHYGTCPRWLFSRMVKLSRAISEIIIYEYGQEEFLKRISDPYFFQALSCICGYDWHSSGTSTVTCAAIKESNLEDYGIAVTGGKGKTSRKVPEEIDSKNFSLSTKKIDYLKYASRLGAKIDNNCIFDSYSLYHHTFIFTEKAKWAIIQQGMNLKTKYARRYHWLFSNVKDFVNEPHNAVCCDKKENDVLNMIAKKSKEARKVSVDLVKDNPKRLIKYAKQKTLFNFKELNMPKKHSLTEQDLSQRVIEQLKRAYEIQPKNYEELVALRGIGAKSIRALALISELIYNTKPSWDDISSITKFSFAHGGKDGYPYEIDCKTYSKSIEILNDAIKNSKLGNTEKLDAIKRLNEFIY